MSTETVWSDDEGRFPTMQLGKASCLRSLRYRLIAWLARGDFVILNASIRWGTGSPGITVDSDGLLRDVHFKGAGGVYITKPVSQTTNALGVTDRPDPRM